MKRVLPCVIMLICGSALPAQPSFEEEALQYLREYLRIDTSNPPGHTLESARFLKSILEREGIATTLYESAPGSKANLLARLSATVAADKIVFAVSGGGKAPVVAQTDGPGHGRTWIPAH